jgi:hypothetical protein
MGGREEREKEERKRKNKIKKMKESLWNLDSIKILIMWVLGIWEGEEKGVDTEVKTCFTKQWLKASQICSYEHPDT